VGLLDTKDPTFTEVGRRIPHKGGSIALAVAAPDSDLAAALVRGRTDKVWWTRRFLGIEEHPGQQRFSVAATMRDEDGYSPAFLDIAQSSGNRAGKTLNLATTILHQSFYKLGVRPPDPTDRADLDRWLRAPFNWYHVSYEGKVSYLVHNELRMILTGSHPAQRGRGCPLVDELGPIVEWDRKEMSEYPWIRVHPAFGGGEIHFRHTNEKAKALLGLDMNGISFDEAAFELYLADIRSEVLHLRRLSTGGPIYWISTGTEGYNAFADLWEEGNPANPRRHPRMLSLRMSTRDNIGFGITQSAFDSLVETMDEHIIPQNIDGQFIEAREAYFNAERVEAVFADELPDEQAPVRNHRYVQSVDPGIMRDATWSLVLDFTKRPYLGVKASRKGGRQSITAVVNMAREPHLLYNSDGAAATTIMDETGIGKVFRQEFSMIRPLRCFDFGGTKAKKLQLLSDLKTVIDRGDLKLPRTGSYWPQVRRQLLGYKLDDGKIEQDAVMTLAMAVRHATRNPASPLADPSFEFFTN
jgi:hypothetical protein